MDYTEKTIKSDLIYDGKILKLYNDVIETCDGNQSTREYVSHNGGACILAIDEEQNVYLVEQYRYAYRETILELPAGKLEKYENPIRCAIRELREEIGAECEHINEIALIYPTPGYSNEPIHIFLATGLKFGHNQLDEGEFLSVKKMPFKEALELVDGGVIKDSKTMIAILKYALFNK